MISIFSAFSRGLKEVTGLKKLVFIFYVFQVVFAYILTKPFSDLLSNTFGFSTLSDSLVYNFNYTYFSLMFKESGQGVNLFGLFLPMLILYLLITVFLTAGVYWLFFTKSKFKLLDYLFECGKYFSRFLNLYFTSFLFYLACFLVFILLNAISSGMTENVISEVLPVTLRIVSLAVFIILIFFVMILFDYAKIILITENHSGNWSAVFEALKFFRMNLFKSTGIYLLYILSAIFIFFIFKLLTNPIVTDSVLMISLFFVLSQLFVFLRQYLRLALFDSVIIYYQETVTALPGMLNKEMLDEAVENYEKKIQSET